MLYLSRQQSTNAVSTTVLASEMEIPYRFLRRILLRLSEKGLLISLRGKQGGLRLARPAATISLLDVVNAVDSATITLNSCLLDSDNCLRSGMCTVHQQLSEIQQEINQRLASISLATLASSEISQQ
jgi:Rrf2 family protein